MFKQTILKNKLKVITYNIPGAHGVTTGVFVNIGSRYESNKLAGISHFIEHMLFKGTLNRPDPSDIANDIEGIGGYLNAATSQDYTFYYNRVPYQHATKALDVLGDMLNNSVFDKQAIERERGVILEELNMYLDTPTRYIYDLIMQTIWPKHSLGRDVIGTRQSIKGLKREDFLSYLKNNYQPQRMVLVAAGRVDHTKFSAQAKKYFSHWKNSSAPKFDKVSELKLKSRTLLHPKKTDQVHLAIATPSLPYGHKDEAVLSLLDTILGSGMSSRLFLNIREKRGLCYSISSFVEKFNETGVLGITAGLNISKITLALKAIMFELEQLTKIKVSYDELSRAKEYLRGSMNLRMDNTDNMAIFYGAQAMFYKKIETPQQKIKKLLQVTENDIIKLANKLFNLRRLNLAIIGPFTTKDKQKFNKLLKF